MMEEDLMLLPLGTGNSSVYTDFTKHCQFSSFCDFVQELLIYEQKLPLASCFNNEETKSWEYHTTEPHDDVNKCIDLLAAYAERHRLISAASAIEQLLTVKRLADQNVLIDREYGKDALRKVENDQSQQYTLPAPNTSKRRRGRPKKRKFEEHSNQKSNDNQRMVSCTKDNTAEEGNTGGGHRENVGTLQQTEISGKRPRRSCKRFERIMAELSKSSRKNDSFPEKEEEGLSEVDDGVSSQNSQDPGDDDMHREGKDEFSPESEIIVFKVEVDNTPNEDEDIVFKEKTTSKFRKYKKKSRSKELNEYYMKRKMHAMNKVRDGRIFGTQTELSGHKDPLTCMMVEIGENVKVHRIGNYLQACSRRCQTDEYNCYVCECSLNEQKDYSNHIIKCHTDSASYFCKICNSVIENKDLFQSHMFCHDGKFYCMQCHSIFISREALLRHFGSLFTLHCPISDCDAVMYSCNEDKYFSHLRDHIKRVPAVLKVMHGVQPGIGRTVSLGAEFPLWMIVNLTGEVWASVSEEQIQVATDLQLEILEAIKGSLNEANPADLYNSGTTAEEVDASHKNESSELGERGDTKFDMTKLPLNILSWYQHVNISIECGKLTITRKKVYECVMCDKQFSSIGGKLKHDQVHHQPAEDRTDSTGEVKDADGNVIRYECDKCGSSYSSKMGCVRHMQRIHHYDPVHPDNPRKYLCRFCAEEFRSSDMLNEHIEQRHKAERFQCDQCSYHTCKATRMKLHVQKVHDKKVEYKCDTCGQEFVYKNLYKMHVDGHKGVKPFPCDTCGQGFATKQRCERHQTVHANPHQQKPAQRVDVPSGLVTPSAGDPELQSQIEPATSNEQLKFGDISESGIIIAEMVEFDQKISAAEMLSGLATEHGEGLSDGHNVYLNPNRVTIVDPSGQVMNVVRQGGEGGEQFVLVTIPQRADDQGEGMLVDLGMKQDGT